MKPHPEAAVLIVVPARLATKLLRGVCGCGHPIASRSEKAQQDAYLTHHRWRKEFRGGGDVIDFAAKQMARTIREGQEHHE